MNASVTHSPRTDIRSIGALLCLAALLIGASAHPESGNTQPPLDPGLTEGVETRLVQFEVRVLRKGVPVGGLGAADFDIELGGKPLAKFTVDDMCVGASDFHPGAPAPRPGSYLFYFDEPQLTVEGRIRSIEVARRVAPALLARGHDLMILRNGTSLRTETTWTHDGAEVSAALDRIAADPGNGDSSRADFQQVQAENLLDRLTGAVREAEFRTQIALRDAERSNSQSSNRRAPPGSGLLTIPREPAVKEDRPNSATTAAQRIAQTQGDAVLAPLFSELQLLVQDELQRIERDMGRLRGTVSFLALRETPKGLVYFADTLRRDPGDVIVRALDSSAQITRFFNDDRWRARIGTWNADAEFDALVRVSSTYGVRFYAVEGRGLAGPSNWVRTSQDTLASMALETGGLFFLNGIAPERIADRVALDQACWYLVSFAPSAWDTDRPLNLGVWLKPPGLRAQTRSSLVIPSRATLTEARLVAAHFGDPAFHARPLSLSIYPVGGTAKRLEVLAQVRFPESDMPSTGQALWDIGFDVVSDGAIVAHSSNRVTWRGSGQPPVYQTVVSLPTGSYEIVAVAHEVAADSIRTGRFSGTWPPSSGDRVALSLPALAQPQRGGIVLDGRVKASGIVVRGAGNPVDPQTSAAFVTAACLPGTKGAALRAERRIVGETEVSFAPMELLPDGGRCVQIRDLVAAGSLGAGRLTYFVRILSGDAEVASQELAFEVTAPPGK